MNLEKFYNSIRKDFKLTTQNVSGFDYIIKEAIKRKISLGHLAYILSTTWHETAHTMQPIRELGGETYLKSKKYYPYVGMGYVQLTWKTNYEKATKYFKDVLKTNVDFVKNPKLLLKPEYAAIILFVGMQEGWFTGKKLSDYINSSERDYEGARKVVNGTDKAKLLADYANKFREALLTGGYALGDTQKPVQPVTPITDTVEPSKVKTSLVSLLVDLIIKLFGGKK